MSQIAGRLKFFISEWQDITSDPTILSWIKGYKIPFVSVPTQLSEPKERAWSISEEKEITLIISQLIKKGAISKCLDEPDQFISDVFLTPKSDGSFRFILNLKKLNQYVYTSHFKMEDVRTAANLVTKDYGKIGSL